jgi:predicted N-formylglutamate amidohydrolase
MGLSDDSLLQPGDPPAVAIANPRGRSAFLLVCDHAGRAVPRRLCDLGVRAADWDRHIAWDIGAAAVCDALWPMLDAVCITQAYSRLVIDCNRRPGHPTSITPESDGTVVPGTLGLSEAARAARVAEIFNPYHAAIAAELDRRARAGLSAVVIAVHSFTPVFGGRPRPWEAGVLFNRAPALSLALAAALRAEGFEVGENEPYRLSDDSDYTVPVHAESRRLPYVELELRQDLIADPAGQAAWAERLGRLLPPAYLSVRSETFDGESDSAAFRGAERSGRLGP